MHLTTLLIVLCVALVLVGAVVAVRWGGAAFEAPPTEHPSRGQRALRALWYLDVHVAAGIATGLLVIGPGSRLAMRLLAVTAGDDAQGRITEAQETVGRISVEGTVGLIIFVGLFGGVLVAAAAGLLRPWLPHGRLGALCVAAALLLTGATRSDPLRPDNPDFDLVGPAWLAIGAFAGLILLAALTFEAIAARTSRSLPQANLRRPTTLLPYAPLLLPLASGVGVLAVVGIVVFAFVGGRPALDRWWDGPIRLAGRVVLVVAALALAPLLVGDLWTIAT